MGKELDGILSASLLMNIPPYPEQIAANSGFVDDASEVPNFRNACFDRLGRPCVALGREAGVCQAMVAAILLAADRNTAAKVVMQGIDENVGTSGVVYPAACSSCNFGVTNMDIETMLNLASTLKTSRDSARFW